MSTLTLSQRKIWLAGIKFNSTPTPGMGPGSVFVVCHRLTVSVYDKHPLTLELSQSKMWLVVVRYNLKGLYLDKQTNQLTNARAGRTLVYVYKSSQNHNSCLFQILFKSCPTKITYTNKFNFTSTYILKYTMQYLYSSFYNLIHSKSQNNY